MKQQKLLSKAIETARDCGKFTFFIVISANVHKQVLLWKEMISFII